MEKVTLAHTDVDLAEARRRLNEVFPTREGHLLWQLAHYASTGQTFDATFFMRSWMRWPASARVISAG
jgi:hypothetical protein